MLTKEACLPHTGSSAGVKFDSTDALLAERAETYGDPVTHWARVAEVWSGILGFPITAHEATLCMVGLKLVRSQYSPDHADSRDDAAGYVRINQMINDNWNR